MTAELYECRTAGITEEDGGIRAFFDADADAGALLHLFAEFAPELRQEPPTDWEQVSRDAWPPLLVGQRFYLVPPWRAGDPTPPGRLRLVVHPGMACGTGRHPCTQLCLEAIEEYVLPGSTVFDVGSGSGILSAAASLLGANVIGCDIDLDAVRTARERIHQPMFAGSADAVCSGWAGVVVANIDAATIERLASDFARVRKPDSTLILSGFPHWDVPSGYVPKVTLKREEWLCWIC